MKKILQILVLGTTLLVNAQTPIYHFNFDNTLSDINNTVRFVPNPGVVSTANPTYLSGYNGSIGLQVNGTFNVQANLPNLPQGNNPRTVMIRVRSFPINGVENPLFHYGSIASLESFGLKHDEVNSGNITSFCGGSGNQRTITPDEMDVNQFYLLTVTYDGTNIKVYRNSKQLFSYSINLNTNGTLFKIGQFLQDVSTYNSVGFRIDDLKIFDTCLTINQISKEYVYHSDLNNGLVAFYDFENNLNSHNGLHNFQPNGTIGYAASIDGGKAVSFSETGLMYNTSLNTALSQQNYTICFWEYRPRPATTLYSTSYEIFGSQYFRERQGSLRISAAYDATNSLPEIQLRNTTFLGLWKHYAITFSKLGSSTNIAVYEDGIFKMSTNITQAANLYKFNDKFTIGSGTDAAGNFMNVKNANLSIDKFFIYNRVLKEYEINLIKDQHQNALNYTSLSSSEFNPKTLKITLYPNPVNQFLNIDVENEIKSIEIYNLQGQKIVQFKNRQIDMTDFKEGIYLLKIEDTNDKIITKHIIKR
ncbi:T9SS C-terminal target domain-containing protein [Flavobacterium columnare]|uniref:T9SS C-terminal target domain-containing protein n=1 Tax=Flavobacterium columnare TaxID=996 RepID=A0A437U846_9FLAO|nr:LamG-like jellyroll fold domain-containing protein [Flavobacterium columnare]RVU89765.1 T9SS C-terminal target domain-containing protein [Flavobacterium columnare]